ncbi:MAG TPA: XrtA system polysaccharide deacetylase [Terriglobales bacterium]|nr:XrtA system polysaccharide deacetylase [Terriglobales bacterium]
MADNHATERSCIFSIDVEDWFHILDLPSTPQVSEWDALPSRVEANFLKLLNILSETGVKGTCFFLGWVAKKFPYLVREALSRGHEIASHGFGHQLVYRMTSREFYEDAAKAKETIEEIAGKRVLGYRASGFSVTLETPWFAEKLMEAGYQYDSSIFPATRGHGGLRKGNTAPYLVDARRGFVEFPISVQKVWGKPVCFFGGGYLRIFPYTVIRKMTQRVLSEGRPAIFYVHPREIDPDHPRLPMGRAREFRSYVNLRSTESKIRRLVSEFKMTSFADFLLKNPFECDCGYVAEANELDVASTTPSRVQSGNATGGVA